MLDSGMNLITTVIGFGMSVTFIVFVCTRLICGRIRAADSRRMFEFETRIDLEQSLWVHRQLICLGDYFGLIILDEFGENNVLALTIGKDLDLLGHPSRGLQPHIVAAIPTLKFNREAFSSSDDTQCTICLGEYEEKEVLRIMPKCSHSFHLSCIDTWLRIQTTCPICRLPLNSSTDRTHNRPAEFIRYPSSFASPEISVEHSQHMVLPDHSPPEQVIDLENIEVVEISNERR